MQFLTAEVSLWWRFRRLVSCKGWKTPIELSPSRDQGHGPAWPFVFSVWQYAYNVLHAFCIILRQSYKIHEFVRLCSFIPINNASKLCHICLLLFVKLARHLHLLVAVPHFAIQNAFGTVKIIGSPDKNLSKNSAWHSRYFLQIRPPNQVRKQYKSSFLRGINIVQ